MENVLMETTSRRKLADHPAAVEFDLEANAPATPADLAWGSKKMVWWRCPAVGEHGLWHTSVNNRTKPRGTGCPACRGNRFNGEVPAGRSLQARFPQVASELDVERSGFSAEQITFGSKRLAWWRCPHGHDYSATVNQRTNGSHPTGCPYCAGKLVDPERSLAMAAPLLAAELDSSSSGVTAEQLMPNSNQRVRWRCATNADHIWQATPNNRFSRGSGCPYCSGATVSDANRLSVNCPDPLLLEEWDDERNKPLTPRDVSVGSDRNVWWVCKAADDHHWQASVIKRITGRGCPYCAGTRVSSTNRLSTVRPDIARELDVEASGIAADQLSIGSSKVVTWRCTVDQDHVWPARVINRTGGRDGRGTRCPWCKLTGTSAQELQLKAELAAVLNFDVDKTAVLSADGEIEHADIVIDELGGDPGVIVEFDGSWWHGDGNPGATERDAAKTTGLQQAGWIVIRVREHPLPLINPKFDVSVRLRARASEAAAAVLDRMAEAALIPAEQALRYRQMSATGLVNVELAGKLITTHLSRQATDSHQSQDEAWEQMCRALESFAAQHGHCRVPDEIEVRGVSLARWAYKQRTRYRSGDMPTKRADRLQATPSWSFDSPHVAGFCDGHASYLSALRSDEPIMPRQVTVWASNLRARRQLLLDKGNDLPSYQLEAMAEIPGWQWNPAQATFQGKITILQEYLTISGKSTTDTRQRDHWDGHNIGTWINTWRTRRHQMPEQHKRALEELPGWTWDPRDAEWEAKFKELSEFAEINGHVRPSLAAEDEHERALAVWKRNNKNRLRGQDTHRARRLRDLLARYGEELA
jgi:hypothetical protein